MKFLQTSLNTTHSGCKPSTFMSSSIHFFQVFLFLPLHLAPATSTFLQADTQSSPLLRSTCPNHLNLPHLTTSATLCTPRRLYKSTLRFLSFNDTPHIHLTISYHHRHHRPNIRYRWAVFSGEISSDSFLLNRKFSHSSRSTRSRHLPRKSD